MSMPAAFVKEATSKGIAVGAGVGGAAVGVVSFLFGAVIEVLPPNHVYVRTWGRRPYYQTPKEVRFHAVKCPIYADIPAVEYRADGGERHFTRVKQVGVKYRYIRTVIKKKRVLSRREKTWILKGIVFKFPGLFPGKVIYKGEITTPFADPGAPAGGKSEGTDGAGVQHTLDLQLKWHYDLSDQGIVQAHFNVIDSYQLLVVTMWPKVLKALEDHKSTGPVPFDQIFAGVLDEHREDMRQQYGIVMLELLRQGNAVTAAEKRGQAEVQAAEIQAQAQIVTAWIAAEAQRDAATIIANGSLYGIDGHSQGDKAKNVGLFKTQA